eukprot:jgi/Bigna1/66750/fgenesh1_pg.2_\
MSQHYQDMKKSWPSLLISISDENAGKKSKNEPSTQTCLTPKAKIFGLGGVSSTPPRVANFNPCTRRRSFARISTKAFWLESFEVLEIMVEESDLGVSVVKVMVCLKENRIKKQIHFEFNFAKDSCTRIAIELVEEFKEDRQSFAKYPKHAEYVAKKLSEALENKKKMYINHKNLECKIDLEDILIRAGFTLDRENILQGLLKEGLTASDLIDGSLSEEELRYFVPKLGPRKRLCKLLRSEKRDLVAKDLWCKIVQRDRGRKQFLKLKCQQKDLLNAYLGY